MKTDFFFEQLRENPLGSFVKNHIENYTKKLEGIHKDTLRTLSIFVKTLSEIIEH